jgi:hypothetical protein
MPVHVYANLSYLSYLSYLSGPIVLAYTLHLVAVEDAAKRGGFGEERYEKLDFQKKVLKASSHPLTEQ